MRRMGCKRIVAAVLCMGMVLSAGCGKGMEKVSMISSGTFSGGVKTAISDGFSLPAIGNAVNGMYYETTAESAMGYISDQRYPAEILPSGEGYSIEMPDFNTEEFNYIKENGFVKVSTMPLSTFAADVDTGMWPNIRNRMGWGGTLEDLQNSLGGAVRTEELLNYFDYLVDFPAVTDQRFVVRQEIDSCPWNPENLLLYLTVQAGNPDVYENKGNNFVFLIDISGSMDSDDKIGLAVSSFAMLAEGLEKGDRVSIVTYAGDDRVILEDCPGNETAKIKKALRQAKKDCEEWGGGTNGSGGITAAYALAERNFIKGGNNRVIIASDGDMNLGITSNAGLTDLIREKKESGIFLTCLGFGTGNYSDYNMESIADAGNGNYYYIDCRDEARRVLVEKLKSTTVTVAKDVKLQIEFNPLYVESYRQIGYENRQMSADDFEDDTKDGGEVGAGQQVTVLYELKPATGEVATGDLRYQKERELSEKGRASGELATLSIRYKDPDSEASVQEDYGMNWADLSKPSVDLLHRASKDFCFAAAVAEFSMLIRESDYIGNASLETALRLAKEGAGADSARKEFVEILEELLEEEL